MKSTHFQLVIGSLTVIALFFGIQFYRYTHTQNLPPLKERRPDFSLLEITTGKMLSNAEWDGQVVVINFWATWCKSCLKEIPWFIKLQQTYARQGIQFIGIAMDNEVKTVKRVANNMRINYPIFVGPQTLQLAKTFGNASVVLPFTVVVDQQGYMVWRVTGEISERVIKRVLLPLLST